ncbi:VanZ family protein [Pelagibaculum spongiae]|uniref:Teicoplanin resistance protein VanZ n=1 Tax=Pelagibaculum spongiae TaxID=2080658 RepID=A0A2V1GRA8_9GAMM|nr:VanZ family protein [Pelagibaculum spongiae]PVZ63550.1 teicoplanin resistance protein VanZ [Pelagibaculum spongiae]
MDRKRLPTLWVASLLASLAIVLWLALRQGSVPLIGHYNDKLLHIIAFTFLAAHCRIALPKIPATIQVVGLISFALLIELLQLLLPWRYFSWMDIAADAVGMMIFWGIFAGVMSFSWLKKHFSQH